MADSTQYLHQIGHCILGGYYEKNNLRTLDRQSPDEIGLCKKRVPVRR